MTSTTIERLSALIEHGKFEEARVILQSYCDNSKTTLLHVASEIGNAVVVQYLLSCGIDINAQDNHGRTAIMLALENKHYAMVSVVLPLEPNLQLEDIAGQNALTLMLEGDNDPVNIANILSILENEKGKTLSIKWKFKGRYYNGKAIYNAIDFDNADLLRLLLENGYPVNCKMFGMGKTPLHEAFQTSNLKIAKVLLEYGADVDIECNSGKIPLAYYGEFDNSDLELEVLTMVFDRATTLTTLYHKSIGSSTAAIDRSHTLFQIDRLLRDGNRRLIKALLQSNAVDWRAIDGEMNRTPLHCLAENPNLFKSDQDDLFDLLVGKNFDIDAVDKHGKSALYKAVDCNKPGLLQFLLDEDAIVRDSDKLRFLQLLVHCSTGTYSAREKYKECVDLLLQHVLDPQIEFYVLKCQLCPALLPYGMQCTDCFGGVQWSRRNSISLESTPDRVKRTLLDMTWDNKDYLRTKLILAHLALIDASGRTLNDSIHTRMDSDAWIRHQFNSCKRDLNDFKETKVSKSITLFDLICASEEKLVLYLRDEELFIKLKSIDANAMSKSIYTKIFWNRLKKSFRIFEARKNAVSIVCEVTGLSYEAHYMIVEKIIGYFWSNRAVRTFSKIQ